VVLPDVGRIDVGVALELLAPLAGELSRRDKNERLAAVGALAGAPMAATVLPEPGGPTSTPACFSRKLSTQDRWYSRSSVVSSTSTGSPRSSSRSSTTG